MIKVNFTFCFHTFLKPVFIQIVFVHKNRFFKKNLFKLSNCLLLALSLKSESLKNLRIYSINYFLSNIERNLICLKEKLMNFHALLQLATTASSESFINLIFS